VVCKVSGLSSNLRRMLNSSHIFLFYTLPCIMSRYIVCLTTNPLPLTTLWSLMIKLMSLEHWLTQDHFVPREWHCYECESSGLPKDLPISSLFLLTAKNSSMWLLCSSCLTQLHSITSPLSVLVTTGVNTPNPKHEQGGSGI
jgi:hypothetical protein